MDLLFIKTSPVKQYSYEYDFSGVFDALHQSLVFLSLGKKKKKKKKEKKKNIYMCVCFRFPDPT